MYPHIPRSVAGETEKILITFILVDSQKFKTQGVDFNLILESFYVCKCDRNIFTQRLINLSSALMFLRLFKMPRALFHK